VRNLAGESGGSQPAGWFARKVSNRMAEKLPSEEPILAL